MSQPVQTVINTLLADASVTVLVSTRITPIIAKQNIGAPFVTVMLLGVEPQNHLRGYANLDNCRVIVTAWAPTYAAAMAIGEACRNTMQAAGYLCESRDTDQYDPDPGMYHTEHQYLVWL